MIFCARSFNMSRRYNNLNISIFKNFAYNLLMNRGNVLFLILLAVALFAALSYAVTQAGRSGGKDISDEDARLAASQITQYATLLEQTVTRLRLSNGCRDTQISFAADSDGDGNWYDTDDDYHNPNAPSDFSCHVFHADGGAIYNSEISDGLNDGSDWVFTGRNRVIHVGISSCPGGSGDPTCPELMALLRNLPLQTCISINENLGINNPSGAPDQDSNNVSFDLFEGVYDLAAAAGGVEHQGSLSGCFEGDNNPPSGTYHFYHVLIAR